MDILIEEDYEYPWDWETFTGEIDENSRSQMA
jgi:hypothetical protein